MNEYFRKDHEYRNPEDQTDQETWTEAIITLAVMLLGAVAWVVVILIFA